MPKLRKCVLCGREFKPKCANHKACKQTKKCREAYKKHIAKKKREGYRRYAAKQHKMGRKIRRPVLDYPPNAEFYNPPRYCQCGCGLELYREYRWYLPGHLEAMTSSNPVRTDGNYIFADTSEPWSEEGWAWRTETKRVRVKDFPVSVLDEWDLEGIYGILEST